mgnify:CR=1 FL=1
MVSSSNFTKSGFFTKSTVGRLRVIELFENTEHLWSSNEVYFTVIWMIRIVIIIVVRSDCWCWLAWLALLTLHDPSLFFTDAWEQHRRTLAQHTRTLLFRYENKVLWLIEKMLRSFLTCQEFKKSSFLVKKSEKRGFFHQKSAKNL